MRKPTFWFLTWSDTNKAVQLQKIARGLKFLIYKVVGLYYLCSENKGADQLRGYREADRNREADLRLCFRICKMLVFSRRGSNVFQTIIYQTLMERNNCYNGLKLCFCRAISIYLLIRMVR